MPTQEFKAPHPTLLPPFDLRAMAVRLNGEPQYGFVTAARRSQTPHVVTVNGLSSANLRYEVFCRELQKRIEWCKAHTPDFAIDPLGSGPETLTGRAFRFADPDAAMHFREAFPTQL